MAEQLREASAAGPTPRPVVGVKLLRHGHSRQRGTEDLVAVEEPLEIRLQSAPIAVVMRTPGADLDLAVGFLLSEGLIRDPSQVEDVSPCRDEGGAPVSNVVRVRARGVDVVSLAARQRLVAGTSACGLCGTVRIEEITRDLSAPRDPKACWEIAEIQAAAATLSASQELFRATGGTHAASVVRRNGQTLGFAEDVGRHNAADKVIGALARRGPWPVGDAALVLSGRVAFELVQKAAVAGLSGVIAVGAPTSLALELAARRGIFVAAFVRGDRLNLYAP